MEAGDGPFSGGPYGSLQPSSSRLSRVTTSEFGGEAHLITRATSTAIVAARSILMSGGTEETALKTAKAAAQSVLNPKSVADGDSVSGRSTIGGRGPGFLRRRKAKRQAEVVASMALVSAMQGGGHDWEMMSTSGQSHQFQGLEFMQFPTNVAFNTMANRSDEPSEISTPIKSPKGTSPRLGFLPPRPPNKGGESTAGFSAASDTKPPRAPSPSLGAPAHAVDAKHSQKQQKPKSKQTKKSSSNEPSSQRKQQQKKEKAETRDLAAAVKNADPIYCKKTEEEGHTHPAIGSIYVNSESTEEDATVDTLTTNGENTSDKKSRKSKNGQEQDFIKDHLDPMLSTFTNAFNAFACHPLTTTFGEEGEDDSTPTARKDKRSSNDDDDARDDTEGLENSGLDDDSKDTEGSDARETDSKSSFDSELHATSRSSSQSEGTSVDSQNIVRELNMSTSTEGEIQVRSTIRDKMERIASKSNVNGAERTWRSYELSQPQEEIQKFAPVVEKPKLPKDPSKKTKTRKKKGTPPTPSSKPSPPSTTNPEVSADNNAEKDISTSKKGWLSRIGKKEKLKRVPTGSSF